MKFFEEYPNPVVPEKFFEKVTDHIWEIKTHCGKEQFRLLASIEHQAVIIAVHGLAKKTMKLPVAAIRLADARRRDYRQRQLQKEPTP